MDHQTRAASAAVPVWNRYVNWTPRGAPHVPVGGGELAEKNGAVTRRLYRGEPSSLRSKKCGWHDRVNPEVHAVKDSPSCPP